MGRVDERAGWRPHAANDRAARDRKTNVFVTKRNDNGLKSSSLSLSLCLLSGALRARCQLLDRALLLAAAAEGRWRQLEPENARCVCPNRAPVSWFGLPYFRLKREMQRAGESVENQDGDGWHI